MKRSLFLGTSTLSFVVLLAVFWIGLDGLALWIDGKSFFCRSLTQSSVSANSGDTIERRCLLQNLSLKPISVRPVVGPGVSVENFPAMVPPLSRTYFEILARTTGKYGIQQFGAMFVESGTNESSNVTIDVSLNCDFASRSIFVGFVPLNVDVKRTIIIDDVPASEFASFESPLDRCEVSYSAPRELKIHATIDSKGLLADKQVDVPIDLFFSCDELRQLRITVSGIWGNEWSTRRIPRLQWSTSNGVVSTKVRYLPADLDSSPPELTGSVEGINVAYPPNLTEGSYLYDVTIAKHLIANFVEMDKSPELRIDSSEGQFKVFLSGL